MSVFTYSEAVHLFECWGFQVEAGPRAGEVALILETPDSRTYAVYPTQLLPEMATIVLGVRWRNGCGLQTPAQSPISCC